MSVQVSTPCKQSPTQTTQTISINEGEFTRKVLGWLTKIQRTTRIRITSFQVQHQKRKMLFSQDICSNWPGLGYLSARWSNHCGQTYRLLPEKGVGENGKIKVGGILTLTLNKRVSELVKNTVPGKYKEG